MYNINMLNFRLKWLTLMLVLATALSPVAQASMVTLAPPACAPMMQTGQDKGCCGSSCDCSIETRSEDLAAVLPAPVSRIELSFDSLVLNTPIEQIKPASSDLPTEEPSPPKDPLYQLYSDYRL